MSETFRFVITEHAAWRITERGRYRVFALPDGGQWLIRVNGCEVLSCPLLASGGEPRFDVFALPRPGMAGREAPELLSALTALGAVARFRTSDLWEATATAIIRQVVRAPHAKRLYRGFCQAHGQRVTHLNGEGYALFPTAETALGLHDEEVAAIFADPFLAEVAALLPQLDSLKRTLFYGAVRDAASGRRRTA